MFAHQKISAQLLLFLLFFTLNVTTQDHEEEQFSAFAQNLGEFNPTESFQFDLEEAQQQTLIFWPPAETKAIRGMFYITSENNNGLFVGIDHLETLQKTFWDKKIGVFNVPYSGTSDIKIILKSELKKITIYLSYELVMPKKKKKQSSEQDPNQGGEQNSELADLLKRFYQIKGSLTGQEQLLKSIIRGEVLQSERLRSEIQSKTIRIIIQTVVLFTSGIISIVMLKREFRKGYELVV